MMPPCLQNFVGEHFFSLGKEAFSRLINQFYFEMTSDILQNSIICAFERSSAQRQCLQSKKEKKNQTKQNKTIVTSAIEKKLICTFFGNALSLWVIIPQILNLNSS